MAELPKTLPPDVAQALAQGRLVEAIKLLRTKHNIGLKEAKGLLEALQKQAVAKAASAGTASTASTAGRPNVGMHPTHAPHSPHAHQHAVAVMPNSAHLSPGEMPRSSSGAAFAVVVLVMMFVIGTAVYFNG